MKTTTLNKRTRAAVEMTDFLVNWGKRKRLSSVKTQSNGGDLRKNKPINKKTHLLRRVSGYNTRNTEVSAGEKTQEGEKGEEGASSSSGGGEAAAAWPRLVVGLTTMEKEEDYLLFKGSKLPQRPKKRLKCAQRVINQVIPGTWLPDVSLDRYEVHEKKISKKAQKTRGLKAMLEGTMSELSE